MGNGVLAVTLVAADTVHLQFHTKAVAPPAPLILDPAWQETIVADVRVHQDAVSQQLDSARVHIIWNKKLGELRIADANQRTLLRQSDFDPMARGELHLRHASAEPFYGIGGYNATESASAGLLRQGMQVANAGEQGHAGAPFVWTTAGYGVLVNNPDVRFTLGDADMDIHISSASPDYFVMLGKPAEIFAALATLSGHTPLFPKWAMGFTNSQWGIDQNQLLSIVDTYRRKHIPIDNFTLDFDWKAWGDDNYGEFRWNPVKFPDGPNGKLKTMLDQRGVHLTGIMKPRIHLDTVEGHYAKAHGFWFPDAKPSIDYFSHKPVKDIDFDIPAARAWFFNDALKHSFDTGMIGWWNDEADDTGDNTEFMNMQRALYDGQRAYSPLRVWSINRNFWLGSQRYAYGLWSGDIDTGFASMAAQRQRMLSAVDVGAMQWGMDGGGFKGHPSDENYARWIEFGAFTPIFRVHGTYGEKRQPWVYGPVAEKAATAAIRLRYALIPYIYSYENTRRLNGVGLVRPLLFDWPGDPQVRNDVDAWMFGDWLLVSPVVVQSQTAKDVYLPAGTWTEWFTGKVYAGGARAHLTIDSTHWNDIPLFVRQGAIIPMQPVMDYIGQQPVTRLDIDMFPDTHRSQFDLYDDDGTTYAYEHGASFNQVLSMRKQSDGVHVSLAASTGQYTPQTTYYQLKLHGDAAGHVTDAGKPMHAFPTRAALESSGAGEGWATGHDRFGDVTYVRIAAARAAALMLTY
jgi:alpha-glucosidase